MVDKLMAAELERPGGRNWRRRGARRARSLSSGSPGLTFTSLSRRRVRVALAWLANDHPSGADPFSDAYCKIVGALVLNLSPWRRCMLVGDVLGMYVGNSVTITIESRDAVGDVSGSGVRWYPLHIRCRRRGVRGGGQWWAAGEDIVIDCSASCGEPCRV